MKVVIEHGGEWKRYSRGDAKNRLKVPSVSWSGLVVAAAENRGGRDTSPCWPWPKQSDHHFSPGAAALSLPTYNLMLSPLAQAPLLIFTLLSHPLIVLPVTRLLILSIVSAEEH